LACRIEKGDTVKVIVNHLRGLFEGEDGIYFGYFLAGYAETIISHTLNEHRGGRYEEYSRAELLDTHLSDKYTLELSFKLK